MISTSERLLLQAVADLPETLVNENLPQLVANLMPSPEEIENKRNHQNESDE